MDIMNKVNELVSSITENEALMAQFKANPLQTVKGLVAGLELDEETLAKLAKAVEGKINIDAAAGLLGGLKKLF